ncbi:MAG: hypothetical protein KY468_00365, partial [Armatimonadetes bacterium]|nr:hypothetical protein [Armatimonadota bacterium]
LERTVYAEPALVPASPWLGRTPPEKPVDLKAIRSLRENDPARSSLSVSWRAGKGTPWLWVVQYRTGTAWKTVLLPGEQSSYTVEEGAPQTSVDGVAVTAVDRLGNAGPPATVGLLPPPNVLQQMRIR